MHCFRLACRLSALLAFFAALPALRADDSDAASERATYADIELKGHYHEGAQPAGLFGELSETLETAIARLDKAAGDEKITGVILRINGPSLGWAKMHAFRKAIGRVQAKGKKVYAWLDEASNMTYMLASACDEVVMPEPATLMTVGVRA